MPSYPDPVIIAGMPRSGVHLLASILDGHAALASGPELPVILTIAHQWRDIAATLGANHERHHLLPQEATRDNFRTTILRLVMPRVGRAGKHRFVYHSYGAAVSLDVLAALFPASPIVVLLRDPRDVALSLLRCNWVSPRDGRPLPYTRDPLAGARMWLEFMGHTARCLPALQAAGRVLLLRYEDLCARPDETMQRLGAHLGEPPARPRVSDRAARHVVATTDQASPPLRVGAVDTRSVGRWRTGLNASDAIRVTQMTESYRRRIGYR